MLLSVDIPPAISKVLKDRLVSFRREGPEVFWLHSFSHGCRLLIYEYCENGSLKEHLHQDGDNLNPYVRVGLLSR